MVDRHTRENFAYMGEEWISRFGRRALFWGLLAALGGAFLWGFNRVDAYLTPSWAKEETAGPRQEIRDTARNSVVGKEARAEAEDHIAISKIGVRVPLSFVQSTRPDDFLGPLKRGVVHYPSALPGEQGTSIILGHSSPLPWLVGEYKRVFSNLKDLEQGDLVSVMVSGKEHTYRVAEKRVLNRGQDIPQELMQSGKPKLLLLSCWPPGIDNKRIMVESDLIKTYE